MYKIDAHNHPYYYGRTPERMLENMDAVGVAKSAILSWECPLDEAHPINYQLTSVCQDDSVIFPLEYVYDFYKEHKDRFIVGYAPDPRKPGAILKLKGAIKTFDVQICGELKLRMMYDNPDAIDMFRVCGEYGLPVILHFDNPEAQRCNNEYDYPRRNYWYGGDIDTLERILKLCPETNFLGHAPGFWCHISKDDKGYTTAYPTGEVIPGGRIEQLLDKYSNLYCDCSAGSCFRALSRDPEYTRKLMERHPDRFIYARDYFDNNLSPFIDSLGLPEDNMNMFYHGNLERILPAKYNPSLIP